MHRKYGNKKTERFGIVFDSKREAERYCALVMLERAGQITDLQRQVAFVLAPPVKLAGRTKPALRYVADFVYTERGNRVVEDAKGVRTEAYRIKRHLLMSVHGIEIREV